MTTTVAVIAAGEMGCSIGERLRRHGARTDLTGTPTVWEAERRDIGAIENFLRLSTRNIANLVVTHEVVDHVNTCLKPRNQCLVITVFSKRQNLIVEGVMVRSVTNCTQTLRQINAL